MKYFLLKKQTNKECYLYLSTEKEIMTNPGVTYASSTYNPSCVLDHFLWKRTLASLAERLSRSGQEIHKMPETFCNTKYPWIYQDDSSIQKISRAKLKSFLEPKKI